jgi:CelD/BcsL family acetyltransferase involved in cellulose biosynthesis
MSPGRLLLDSLVEWSFLQGFREFDFTIGDEPYKGTFCNVSDGLYRRIAARSPLGWAYWLKASLADAHPRVAGARPSKPAAADAVRR